MAKYMNKSKHFEAYFEFIGPVIFKINFAKRDWQSQKSPFVKEIALF